MSIPQLPDRTVVFIGRTGSGKSTCANALAGQADLFKESDGSVSETKNIDAKLVPLIWQTHQYTVKIVDTIGIGDTNLPPDEVLKRLAHACYECKEGINAVYFVTGGRFTDEEADAFDIMWQVLFGPKVLDYTTIVRTRFRRFRDPKKVETDTALLREQKGAASRIMPNVKHVLYVDNPPPEYSEGNEARKKSQDILLSQLAFSTERYKPPVLDEVNEKISEHVENQRKAVEKQEQLEKELKEARTQNEKLRLQSEIKEQQQTQAKAGENMVQGMTGVIQKKEQGIGERILGGLGALVDSDFGGLVMSTAKRCSVM